jgi:hypothetical protein
MPKCKRKFEDGGYVNRDKAPSERGRVEREFTKGMRLASDVAYGSSRDKNGDYVIEDKETKNFRKKAANEIRDRAWDDAESYDGSHSRKWKDSNRYAKGGAVKAKTKAKATKKPASKKKR